MNYIRGAVNAISAPYQYYKELPPINPSTLTGAIDVIVIQRPGSDGETELACSPFHVRFGKWQVLRPSDKQVRRVISNFSAIAHSAAQVKISVNNQPIPFHMKIGEAGEAFFVFETDEDVPEDLITSPILLPTKPEEDLDTQTDATVGHFGMKRDHSLDDVDASGLLPEPVPAEISGQEAQNHNQEPEFLDLSAGIRSKEQGSRDVNLTPKQEFHQPSFLRHSASRNTIRHRPLSESFCSQPELPISNSRSPTPEFNEQDKRVDEVLRHLNKEVKPPGVEYHRS